MISAKPDEKVSMFKRGGEVFVRHTLLKNEVRLKRKHIHLKLEGKALVSFLDRLPKNSPGYGHLQTLISYKETTKDNPSFKFKVQVKKTKEKVLELEFIDGIKTKNSYIKFLESNDELFITTRTIKGFYQLDNKEFKNIELPLNLNINSVNYLDDRYILGANGRYVLEHKVGETGEVKTSILKRLTQAFHSSAVLKDKIVFLKHKAKKAGTDIFDLEEELIHTTAPEFRFYKTNSEEELLLRGISSKAIGKASITKIDGEVLFEIEGSNKVQKLLKWDPENYYYIQKSSLFHYNSSTLKTSKLMTMSGKRVNHLIKTPNDKLLLLNDGQVQLYNPASRSLASLTTLDMDSLVKVKSFTLKDNMLFFIDKLNKLHKVTIPNHKLTLFDELE